MRSSGGERNKKKFRFGTIPGSVTTRQMRRYLFLAIIFFFIFGTIIFTVCFPDEWGVHRCTTFLQHKKYYVSIRGEISAIDKTVPAPLPGQRNVTTSRVQNQDKLEPPKFQKLSEAQLPHTPYNLAAKEREWQKVSRTKSKFFVYAAYAERRKPFRGVRIIAATKTISPDRVWCRLWYRTKKDSSAAYISKTIPATSKAIKENGNLNYSACFVLCPLANQTFPTFVSIVTDLHHPPSNLLTVMDNFNATVTHNFTVCVKPLHSSYNLYLEVLEFFELNMLLGVTHFTIYNHTAEPQVSCVLRHYIDRGLLTLLPWQLDLSSEKEIRTEGIFAALNDCLYRTMYKAAYTLFIDLDEFIVPRDHETIPELIEYWNAKLRSPDIGTFLFQNGFYYRGFENDEYVQNLTDPVTANLLSVSKTRREINLYSIGQRSKYITQPEKVVEVGNHFIWEAMPGYKTYNVPPSSAFLNHYRRCEIEWNCLKKPTVVDRTAHKYKEKLMMRVRRQFDKLKDECDLSAPRFPSRNAPKSSAKSYGDDVVPKKFKG